MFNCNTPGKSNDMPKNLFFKGMFDRVRIKVYRGYLLGVYPVEVFGKVRYGFNTLPDTPVCFGANSIPVLDNSAS